MEFVFDLTGDIALLGRIGRGERADRERQRGRRIHDPAKPLERGLDLANQIFAEDGERRLDVGFDERTMGSGSFSFRFEQQFEAPHFAPNQMLERRNIRFDA